ncbi:MAG: hypothetical protein O7C67_05725 [Gammaproteobacteria bacterium]|nr:hypothetical protein [Gammaproteobacteria bacterium]
MTATQAALTGRMFKHAGSSYLVTDTEPRSMDVLNVRRVDRSRMIEEFAVVDVLKCLGSDIVLD